MERKRDFFSVILWVMILSRFRDSECRPTESKPKPIVMVVSYDGFGNGYFDTNQLNHMEDFRNKGVYAPRMKSVFPTKAFPNHFSIATGLYPEEHGVLQNSLYDTELGNLTYGYDLFHYKKDVLPIWTLNEKNGGVSGCMMWPGSDFEYSNVNCTYTYSYNRSVPLKERVDIVMKWLENPEKPANLIMFYSEEPDHTGHLYGPSSPETIAKVKEMDKLTKYIQDQLQENDLLTKTNVIHLSDHGMVDVSSENFIDLTKLLENGTYSLYGASSVLQIVPTRGKEGETYKRLKEAATKDGHFNIYHNSDLNNRWHCKNSRRFAPIIAVSELNYAFNDMYKIAEYYSTKYNISFTSNSLYGVHGYDNILSPMYGYFMAKGPIFKKSHITTPFDNIDLFSLICEVLEIKNSPKTSGNFNAIKDILSDSSGRHLPWWAYVIASILGMAGTVCIKKLCCCCLGGGYLPIPDPLITNLTVRSSHGDLPNSPHLADLITDLA